MKRGEQREGGVLGWERKDFQKTRQGCAELNKMVSTDFYWAKCKLVFCRHIFNSL